MSEADTAVANTGEGEDTTGGNSSQMTTQPGGA
jgi:hypothetical protein